MADLGWILALPALLITVGFLFVVQYKLAVKERKWLGLIIPALILTTYLVFAVIATQATNSFDVRVLEGVDGHGNILKITIQEPKDGTPVKVFSNLMIYNEGKVLVDEVHLYYHNNKPEEEINSSNLTYDKYIQKMLNGLRLDGISWDVERVTKGVTFMGLSFGGNIHKALAFVFAIPFMLILLAGILPRFVNRKKIRAKALAKVDIQSLENGDR